MIINEKSPNMKMSGKKPTGKSMKMSSKATPAKEGKMSDKQMSFMEKMQVAKAKKKK